MKQALLLSIAAMIFLFQGCCKPGPCERKRIVEISFSGFSLPETDTIITTSYTREGDGFSTPHSWPYVVERERNDTAQVYSLSFDSEFNWDVYLPALDTHFRIQDYTFATMECPDNCFGRKKRLPTLSGFSINHLQVWGFEHTVAR